MTLLRKNLFWMMQLTDLCLYICANHHVLMSIVPYSAVIKFASTLQSHCQVICCIGACLAPEQRFYLGNALLPEHNFCDLEVGFRAHVAGSIEVRSRSKVLLINHQHLISWQQAGLTNNLMKCRHDSRPRHLHALTSCRRGSCIIKLGVIYLQAN